MENSRKTPALKTVEKALDIFDCIAEAPRPLTASETAARMGMSLSSVYKFLSTLTDKDYLSFDSETKQYRPSNRLVHLAARLSGNQQLTQLALPYMKELAAVTKETIHLAVPQGINVVFLEKIDSPHTLNVQTKIGTVSRMDRGATPQAIMALSPEDTFEKLCREVEKEPNSAASAAYLRQLRQQIRQNGYIMSLGQMNVGVAAIAVPVVGADGLAAGAIAVAAPQARYSQVQFLSYVPMLKQASLRISQALGYRQDRLPGQEG